MKDREGAEKGESGRGRGREGVSGREGDWERQRVKEMEGDGLGETGRGLPLTKTMIRPGDDDDETGRALFSVRLMTMEGLS
ncbi:hypothetical protein AAC387_Pa10g2216 [Persea americana]